MCVCNMSTDIHTPGSCKIDVNVYIYVFFCLVFFLFWLGVFFVCVVGLFVCFFKGGRG